MAKRILLLASGAGSLAQAIIAADLDCEIVGLISDRACGALEIAKEAGIYEELVPYISDRLAWNNSLLLAAEKLNPDLVVSLGFMRILAGDFLSRFKTINTHPALLPRYPGAHAVRAALADEAKESGTTVHWVDVGIDTGLIIDQRVVAILSTDTEATLHERIKIAERQLIVETLEKWISRGFI